MSPSPVQGFDCFNAYELNLGEGANTVNTSAATARTPRGTGDRQLRRGTRRSVRGLAGPSRSTPAAGTTACTQAPATTVLHGGEGNDRLFGYDGADQVLGEGGADRRTAGPGTTWWTVATATTTRALLRLHRLRQRPGCRRRHLRRWPRKRQALARRPQRRHGHLDRRPGQRRQPGEGDNVGSDIETIDGTVHSDVFTGVRGRRQLRGQRRRDEIHGAGGNDDLYGGGGDDRVFGDAGNDKVQGASGSDTSTAGRGGPDLRRHRLVLRFCTFDADTLFARDGERDVVDCGGGADTAQVDQLDVVAFCSSVDRRRRAARRGREGQLRRLEEDGEGEPQGPLQLQLPRGSGTGGRAVFRKLAKKSFTTPAAARSRSRWR